MNEVKEMKKKVSEDVKRSKRGKTRNRMAGK